MKAQMIRVISSPSSSTTGLRTLIFGMGRAGYRGGADAFERSAATASPRLANPARRLLEALNHASLLRVPYRATERTEAQRLAARERIVGAAHALIARGGYREASVAAVARRAGVATGTVYRHFG